MFNSKKLYVFAAVSFLMVNASSQTIGDIAAYQRAKAQAELNGETQNSPNVQNQPPQLATSTPISTEKKSIDIKLSVIATYEIDGVFHALLNEHGNVGRFVVGQKAAGYTLTRVNSGGIGLLPQCKKNKKCKSFNLAVGKGI